MHHTGGRLRPHLCGHQTVKRSNPRADRTYPCPSAREPRHHDHGQPPSSSKNIHHERYTSCKNACGNHPHQKVTAPVNAVHGRITATTCDAYASRSRVNRSQRVLLVPWVFRQKCSQRPHAQQHATRTSERCDS